jgi:hypothetical protein
MSCHADRFAPFRRQFLENAFVVLILGDRTDMLQHVAIEIRRRVIGAAVGDDLAIDPRKHVIERVAHIS